MTARTGPRLHNQQQKETQCDPTCPRCGYVNDRYKREIERLRQRGRDLDVNTAGSISEQKAAELLGKASSTLRDWRKNMKPEEACPRFYRTRHNAVSYRLEDLARYCLGE